METIHSFSIYFFSCSLILFYWLIYGFFIVVFYTIIHHKLCCEIHQMKLSAATNSFLLFENKCQSYVSDNLGKFITTESKIRRVRWLL